MGCQTSVSPFSIAISNNQLTKMMSRIDLRMRKKKNIEFVNIGQELLQEITAACYDSMSTKVTPRRSGLKSELTSGVAHSISKFFKCMPSFALWHVYRLPGSG